jgi:hypothetical protein
MNANDTFAEESCADATKMTHQRDKQSTLRTAQLNLQLKSERYAQCAIATLNKPLTLYIFISVSTETLRENKWHKQLLREAFAVGSAKPS